VVSDSTATVIGAMIVAPLMTPILGIEQAVADCLQRAGGQPAGLVFGERAADGDHDPAGPAYHVGAARLAQVTADQPGAGAQTDQRGALCPGRGFYGEAAIILNVP
jgi:hypothetical protein